MTGGRQGRAGGTSGAVGHLLDPILARGAAGHPSAHDVALRRWTRPHRARAPEAREEVTYAELARRVEATAAALVAGGLLPGARVLFSVRPRPEGVVLALAVLRARASVVFVDPGSTPELFAARVAAAAPTWAITESLLYAVSRGPLRRLARSRGLLLPDYAGLELEHVYTGRRLPGVPRGARSARRLAAGTGRTTVGAPGTARVPLPAGDPADEALVVFTSGTTAEPKAVVHTAGSLGAGCDLLRGVFAVRPGESVHTDQMLLGVPALLAGATWSVPADPPGRDVAAFAAQAATAAGTYLVPADVTALLDALEAGDAAGGGAAREADGPGTTRPAPGPRVALVGGAPVTRALLARARRVLPGTRWVGVYGMTEILPVAIVEAADKLASPGDGDLVGHPLPGVTARIDRPAGGSSAASEGDGWHRDPEAGAQATGATGADDGEGVGELVLSGPSLMAGYLADVDRGERAVEHRTGDLARLDPHGRIVLVGRARDMIIRGTVNIYPGLFEPRVAALPGVGEAMLVGVPRDDGDERVVLVVTSATGVPSTGSAGPGPEASGTLDPVGHGTTGYGTSDAGGAVPAGPGEVRLRADHPLVAAVRARLADVVDHGALPDVVLHADHLPLAGRSRKPDRAALARAVAPWAP